MWAACSTNELPTFNISPKKLIQLALNTSTAQSTWETPTEAPFCSSAAHHVFSPTLSKPHSPPHIKFGYSRSVADSAFPSLSSSCSCLGPLQQGQLWSSSSFQPDPQQIPAEATSPHGELSLWHSKRFPHPLRRSTVTCLLPTHRVTQTENNKVYFSVITTAWPLCIFSKQHRHEVTHPHQRIIHSYTHM